jgi:23S rRNA (guanosine2251-2'-O)-methyltransferase
MTTIIYGINPVSEVLKSRPGGIEKIVVAVRGGRGGAGGGGASGVLVKDARRLKVTVETVERGELDRLAGTTKHQGVAAVMKGEFRYSDIEDVLGAWKERGGQALFLILDSIEDPQNLGSLIRAAAAAGANGVVIPKDRAARVTPAVVKVSAGAVEYVPIVLVTNLAKAIETLKGEGVWVVGVEADATEDIFNADLNRDLALVIGSEGGGITRLVRQRCDFTVSIPMAGGVNSLNAAQAGVVSLFEARRQMVSE